MSTVHDRNTSGPGQAGRSARSRPPGQPSLLPDWMRDPPPPRVTLGDRVAAGLLRLPGAPRARQSWWAWQDRRRLYERFPNSFKIVAFFASWAIALTLVLTAWGLFALAAG
ncbi:hypothetical protein GA0070618_0462 [Micromonospora echinospora]|uniref:Uncharacterized protein n=1 Tax=Micromonospora echinospora TaxID=1877 RepID=A0A1C4ULT0_MICEC|nr:hypothetical protein [Micromonospora echinospora]SCE72673.1 hypothetical protein GA0070618_0462 [Micromonospora echinospora]